MKQCLNCQTELRGAYCHHCGQKGSTHRYSLKSLLTHDLLHSVWHVDKSILRSWWQVLRSPGKEGQKNITGKRAGQFPILTLAIFATILILLAINFNSENEKMVVSFGDFDLSDWVHRNAKWLWLSMILFYAIANLIFFRRFQYNLAEHVVMVTYNYVGIITITTLFLLLYKLAPQNWDWAGLLTLIVFFAYLVFANWQSFRCQYTVMGWLWRFLSSFIAFWMIIVLMIFFIAVLFSTKLGSGQLQIQYFGDTTTTRHTVVP